MLCADGGRLWNAVLGNKDRGALPYHCPIAAHLPVKTVGRRPTPCKGILPLTRYGKRIVCVCGGKSE